MADERGVSEAGGASGPERPVPERPVPERPVPERIVTIFARALNYLSAVWLASVALLIVYDVVGRELFLAPFHGTNEIVSNSVLSILMLQLPLSILTRGSLRTTILYGKVRLRGKRVIDALSYALALTLFAVIAYGSWPNMIEGWAIREMEGSGNIQIPVYLIRTLVVLVCAVGVAVCALMLHKAVSRRGRAASTSAELAGD